MISDKKYLEMTEDEYDTYMCKKYPLIFMDRNKDMSQTCMCWGFDIGPGWREMLDKTCENINFIMEQSHIIIIADQVKSKFAGLRFYYHVVNDPHYKEFNPKWNDIFDLIINEAESRSYHTCEDCGDWGQIRKTGWDYTLCDICFDKLQKEREKKNAENKT